MVASKTTHNARHILSFVCLIVLKHIVLKHIVSKHIVLITNEVHREDCEDCQVINGWLPLKQLTTLGIY
jgi:hypothetical protein